MKIYEGRLIAKDLKFAIITSRFNDFITLQLEEGCIDALIRHGADKEKDIIVYRVPGAFELGYVAGKIAKLKQFDTIICLGALIRGYTPHFEYIASQVAKTIAEVAKEEGIPVVFGVITVDSLEQAIERAGVRLKNRGFEAGMTAIELANLYKCI